MTRETNEQMIELLLEEAGEGDFVPSLVAAAVFERLDKDDPDFLVRWLYENGPKFLTAEFTRTLGRQRANLMNRRGQDRFAKWASESDPQSLFEVRYRIDDDFTARKLGDMDASDHGFVAASYENSGNRELMLAALHRAVAKKLTKGRKTSEVLSEEQYARLFEDFTGEPPTAIAV